MWRSEFHFTFLEIMSNHSKFCDVFQNNLQLLLDMHPNYLPVNAQSKVSSYLGLWCLLFCLLPPANEVAGM